MYTGGQGCGAHSPPGRRCPGQTDDEYITEFSIWAIASGSIIFATDPRNMSAIQKRILLNTEVLAVYRDVSGFMDVRMVGPGAPLATSTCAVQRQISHAECVEGKTFGCNANATMWVDGGCRAVFECDGVSGVDCESNDDARAECKCVAPPAQVWVRPLATGGAAVVLFNPNDAAQDVTVSFADVPQRKWTADTELAVRDLWAHVDVGTATGSYTFKDVAVHGSAFLTLTPKKSG